jgi:serine/threonine protein kinase
MSQAKPSTSEPAEIAGRYQVVKKLGAGAFGTVYKAKDKILGRMVAIKTIRLEGLAAAGASIEELVERFKREAQVSAQLKHPNIVTIYDVGEVDGVSYLAMEFIDGVGLDRVISGAGRVPLDRAAAIGAQIADALDFAHKHGVVHRDIKPANIMIEAGDRVKVTDFGIAKVTTGEHLTMTGSLLGTPSYMSPEQARGSELDGRSDLFAVGAIVYEMLAGQKAFRGDSITGLIFKIITEEPQPIKSLDPDVPEDVVRIIAKALAKAPEARYQSGRELADELVTLTRAGATPTLRQSEMPTSASRPGIPVPPLPGAAGPSTVVSPGTVAGAGRTQVSAQPTQVAPPPSAPVVAPPPPPPPAPRAAAAPAPAYVARPAPAARKSGSGAGLLIGLGLVGLLFAGAAAGGGWYFFLRKPVETKTADGLADAGASTSGGITATTPVTAPPPVREPVETGAAAGQPAETGAGTTGTGSNAADTGTSQPADGGGRTTVAPPSKTTRPPSDGSSSSRTRPADTEPIAEPPPASGKDYSYLEQEQDAADGAEAARRLAQGFGSDRGRGGNTSFGTSGRFKPRDRSPRNLVPVERPAVAVLRHVMNAEEMFRKKNGRYGTFKDLSNAGTLFLDVPIQTKEFQRKGYRFELALEDDGFKVVAMPAAPTGRAFFGDDSGFIQEGID